MTKRVENAVLAITGFIVMMGLWYGAVAARVADPVLLPTPDQVVRQIWKGLVHGRMGFDVLKTTVRMILALTLATFIGLPAGLMLGMKERLYRSVEFMIDFLRSTPASAVFPLFLVVFGVDDSTKIYIGMFGATLAIVFNTAYGAINAGKTRLMVGKLMGASRPHMLLIVFLESLPQTFIGLRSGVSIALVSVIVAEMFLGSTDGIGNRVFEAQQMFDMPEMYAAIFCSGVLGYGLNLVLRNTERHFVHWSGR